MGTFFQLVVIVWILEEEWIKVKFIFQIMLISIVDNVIYMIFVWNTYDMFLQTLNRTTMKAFHQAPVVGHVFPLSQRSCVFFRSDPYLLTREYSRSGPYCYSFSHPHQLVASKATDKKHRRLMVNSLPQMSSPDAWECKDASSESPKNIMVFSQKNLYSN